MRDAAHFKNFLFTLAMGFRFMNAGCHVRLEPKTLRGRGDLLLTHPEFSACCECYRHGYTMNNASIAAIHDRFLDWGKELGERPCMCRIGFTRHPRQGWEHQVRRLIRDTSRPFEALGITQIAYNYFCTVSIQPLPPGIPKRPDESWLSQSFPGADAVGFSSLIPKSDFDVTCSR